MKNFRKLLLSIIFLSIFEKINTGDEPRETIITSLEERIKCLEIHLLEQNKINTLMITIITQQKSYIEGLAKDTEGLSKAAVEFCEQFDHFEKLLSKHPLLADKSKND